MDIIRVGSQPSGKGDAEHFTAIWEELEGTGADWMGKVSDEEYAGH